MNEVIVFLTSLISIVFIVILISWLYQDYRTDAFRQKMFNLRDDLFDEARHGKIDFDEGTYGMLRSVINDFIRFGHKLSLIQVLLLSVMLKREGNFNEHFSEKLRKNMQNCTVEQRKIIMSYHTRMNRDIIQHLFLSSIISLVTLVIPAVFLLGVKKRIEKIVVDLVDMSSNESGQRVDLS